ncbi:MAG: putative peptidoglycan glycosyltransferase FtsW [Actinomycetaceae bacterium]|nr:putative peptidoglycan glycosyltransferase FtsW [Actinomycetaceae bacterium]
MSETPGLKTAQKTDEKRAPTPVQRMLGNLASQPVLSYYLILVCTFFLVIIGTIVVFSASTIAVLQKDASGSIVKAMSRDVAIIAVGLVGMLIASRFPPRFYERLAAAVFLSSLVMQLGIFTPLAMDKYGNNNWIYVPIIGQAQPSEVIKLGLALYLGAAFASGRVKIDNAKSLLWGVGVPTLLALGLIMAGRDLGTALVVAALVVGALFLAGIRLKWLASIIVAGLGAAAFFVMISPNRRTRILGFLSSKGSAPSSAEYQSKHGLWGLGTGGISGVGPGASREKWSYLPEAQTDFIFAILGEEFGLLGTCVVLLLYAGLAIGMFRVMRRQQDVFARVAVGAIASWIFVQTIINIGAIIGLVPIIGVPLPLLSSGGSAMISTLAAIGVVLAASRWEHGAQQAFKAKSSTVKRSLAVLTASRRKHG